MFRNLRLTCAVAALLASALLPSLAGSEVLHSKHNPRLPCAALALSVIVPSLVSAEVTHYRLRGEIASATFYEHPTYCFQTYTDLSVHDTDSDKTYLTVSVSEHNLCEDTHSTVFYASAYVPRDAYRTRGNLSTASLQFTAHGYGRTGAPASATIALTWTGVGEIYSGRSTSSAQWGSGSGSSMTRTSGSSRDATVSGSFMVESRNLAATEEAYGILEISREAYRTIYHPR